MNPRTLQWYLTMSLLAMVAACAPLADDPQSLAGAVTVDGGGVVLEPNVIRGRVRFTNQNPEILALFDSDPRRFIRVIATSTRPTGFSATTPFLTPPNLRGYDFEMQVEAAAGGAGGITYRVAPQWGAYVNSNFYPFYDFQTVNTLVQPRELQPDPATVDFQECVGALRFQWGTDETCQTPVEVTRVLFNGRWVSQGVPRSSSYPAYVRGGTSGAWVLQYDSLDGIAHQRTVSFSAACDQVITVCTAVPPTVERGGLSGPWDIAGEDPLRERLISAHSGPEGDGETISTSRQLKAPVSEPARWWTLPGLVPGGYQIYGRGGLRRGREFTWFRTNNLSATVIAGQVTPLTRLIDGQLRYAFDLHPAYFQGSIRLSDPYVVSHPGARSSLEGLFFENDIDSDRDGAPDVYTYFESGTRFSTTVAANDPGSNNLAFSYTSFPGRFDATTGELASSYEQVLPSAYDLPFTWRQRVFRLGFWAEGTSSPSLFVTRPSEYDPSRFRYGYLDLAQRRGGTVVTTLLAPGQTERIDHAYCFNEIQLEYATTGAPFYNPTASINGSFRGTDWRGESTDYAVTGRAWGIPAAIGIPQSEAVTYAASRGSVAFAVPQGSYTLTPGATLVSASGQINDATFQPITFTVGCGQRLKLVPPLAVNITPQPTCANGPSATVIGTVQSSPAEVDRIWYTVNDGPEIPLCTSCGINPRFSFAVDLRACENTVKVYAYSAGLPEPATSFQQLLWDDPADGPSCADATCVNRPPVARCKSITVSANSACSGCGSIDDGSYDPEDGAVTCTQTPDCPFALGRTRVTLRCTDSSGATASCEAAITVRDDTPPELSCPAAPVLECQADGVAASYAATARDNCSTATTSCTPASGSLFSLGTTAVSCSARDAAGNQSSCSFPVTVADTTPPTITCPAPLTIECTGNGQAQVTPLAATAGDSCTQVTLSGPAAGAYPLGTTAVTYTARDTSGNQSSCSSTITVADTAPPIVHVGPAVTLWPPSHDLRTVSLADCGITAEDACSGAQSQRALQLAITCVSSDEPADAKGDGRTGGDITLVNTTTVKLRAERQGTGDGRVYKIHFTARDSAGHTVPGVCTVNVPHDQSGPPAHDSGENHRLCAP